MKLYIVKGDHLDQTSYILANNGKAVMFDIGVEYSEIKKFLIDNSLTLCGIFITHAHFDHALGARDAQEDGIKIYSSEYGQKISTTNKDLGRFMGVDFKRYREDVSLKDGEEVEVGGFKVTCYYTPGHTIDGACFLSCGYLFGGDTFCGDMYGRFDFPTGNGEELFASLKKMFALPLDLKVLHGHENVFGDGIFEYQPSITLADDKKRYSQGFDF